MLKKGVVNPETCQASETFNKDADFSPSVSKETNTLGLNINGQETFTFYFGGSNSNTTGGIISVKPR